MDRRIYRQRGEESDNLEKWRKSELLIFQFPRRPEESFVSGKKWCEWCYAQVEMGTMRCNYCESESFLHSNPSKDPIDPWEARERRKNRDYANVAPILHKIDRAEQNRAEQHISQEKKGEQEPFISREERQLDKEIADLVVQIEISNRKLQELLARKSIDIKKSNEDRFPKSHPQTVTTKVTEVGVSSGFLDAVTDFFDN